MTTIFMDSGAFSIHRKATEFAKRTGREALDYYKSTEFKAYLDEYAEYLKANEGLIDYYANVDVIRHPQLTYRSQKYLEQKHGLKPVPTIHYPTDLKWLERYIKEGYDYIALGGLVGKTSQASAEHWVEDAFDLVLSAKSPPKIHGFGISNHRWIVKFPWYSIDSAVWIHVAAKGAIFQPQERRDGSFDLIARPSLTIMSKLHPKQMHSRLITKGKHIPFRHRSKGEQESCKRWLKKVNVPFEKVVESSEFRQLVNLRYFHLFAKQLSERDYQYKRRNRRKRFLQ